MSLGSRKLRGAGASARLKLGEREKVLSRALSGGGNICGAILHCLVVCFCVCVCGVLYYGVNFNASTGLSTFVFQSKFFFFFFLKDWLWFWVLQGIVGMVGSSIKEMMAARWSCAAATAVTSMADGAPSGHTHTHTHRSSNHWATRCVKQSRCTMQKKLWYCVCLSQDEPPIVSPRPTPGPGWVCVCVWGGCCRLSVRGLLGERLTDSAALLLLHWKRSSLHLQSSHPSDRGRLRD